MSAVSTTITYSNLPPRLAQLQQILNNGPVWDGNLISKGERDELHKAGLVDRCMGWNFINNVGIATCINIGLLKP